MTVKANTSRSRSCTVPGRVAHIYPSTLRILGFVSLIPPFRATIIVSMLNDSIGMIPLVYIYNNKGCNLHDSSI